MSGDLFPLPSGLKVLVIDSHQETAEPILTFLQQSGFDAAGVQDGVAAIGLADSFKPSCVLLDLRISGMSSVELATRLRQMFGGDIAIVAMAGSDVDAMDYKTMLPLCDFVLTKPVDLGKLRSMVR